MDRIALHSFMVRHRHGVVSSTSGDGTPQSRTGRHRNSPWLLGCERLGQN